MTMKTLAVSATLLLSVSAPAIAQEGAVTGAAGGAVTGAIVGGPVGAAVGGVVGAVAGTAIDPPPERVVTYIREQPLPPQPIIIQQPIAVGEALPPDVVLTPVPEDPSYAYAMVNEHWVIVDPESYVVVQVLP